MKMASAVASLVGKAWSASWDMTNAKWLIAVDTANVLMGNVFVPEDTQDQPASKVSMNEKKNNYWLSPGNSTPGGLAQPTARFSWWCMRSEAKKTLMRFDNFFFFLQWPPILCENVLTNWRKTYHVKKFYISFENACYFHLFFSFDNFTNDW